MRGYLKRFNYYKRNYFFIILFFLVIFLTINLSYNKINYNLNESKKYYSYLNDNYYYAEGFDLPNYVESHTFNGVAYNIDIIEVNDKSVYKYTCYGDINYGLNYNQFSLIEIESINYINTSGVLVTEDLVDYYDEVLGVLDLEFPYTQKMYSRTRVDEYSVIIVFDNDVTHFNNSTYAIFEDSDYISNDDSIVLGSTYKNERIKDVNKILLFFDIFLIIPITISIFSFYFICNYFMTSLIKEVEIRKKLGASKLNNYIYLANDIFLNSSIGFIGGSVIAIGISYTLGFGFINVWYYILSALILIISIMIMSFFVLRRINKRVYLCWS
ncbi:MAG: hypothetical protein K6G48_02100 [Acholeplasmatales bacterium]|nr:hypothetical protein [Acholeplasmatales bacterium]